MVYIEYTYICVPGSAYLYVRTYTVHAGNDTPLLLSDMGQNSIWNVPKSGSGANLLSSPPCLPPLLSHTYTFNRVTYVTRVTRLTQS